MEISAVIVVRGGAVHTTCPAAPTERSTQAAQRQLAEGAEPILPRPTSSGSRQFGGVFLASGREMDLPLYFRVLWRFRLIVLPGFLVAIALAVLAYGKVDLAHMKVTPRAVPQYHDDAL